MNNEKGKNITKKSSKDDLSLQSQEERIKKNTPKNNKRKKIAVATTATVLIATAIAVPTVIYLSRRKFDVNVLTNTDIVEEYTINVKRGVYIRNLTAKQIEGYTFVGFYKDANLTQPYGENDKVSKNMQIYAKYEINIYSLKFPTSPAFTIEGEAIEGNQVNIEYNTEYQFKINLNAGYTESEITVKANGEIIEADSNGYYTLTVKDDIVIEVEGVAINTYTITFYDETGETIYKIEEVEYNQDSTYKEIPTKHSTPTYNYTFAGWVDREGKPVDLTNIIVDKDVYASFTEEYIEYRINKIPSQVVIKNSEGIELTGSNTLHYGDIVEITYNVTEGHNVVDFSVNGAERIEDTNTYKITGDLTVTYSEEIQTFDVTISVNNPEYGTVNITNISVDYGTEIIETFDELKIGEFTIKATPTDDNPTYNYSFVNWTNAVSEVKEDLTITANFVRTMDEYIVSIIVNNADYGSVSQPSLVVNYNTPIIIEGNKLIIDGQEIYAEPKDNTAQYSYEFIDWSNATDVITGNREIIANFNRTTNSYTVTFYDENRTTVLDTLTDEYGTSIVYSGEEPTKSADNTYIYTFECWETVDGEEYDLSGKTITSDLALYARYSETYIEYDISEIPLQVEIRKDDLELSSNDKLHYGDRIEITYNETIGHEMTKFEVTGATREGETNFYTVTGDLTVIYEEDYIDYTISDIPTQITIKRNNIEITTDDVLHYGDRLEIIFNETIGYEMTKFEVTGATREGETNFYTVTGNLTVIYEEDYIDYTIVDIPTQITIKRNNIILTTEDIIHYGDVIEITYNVTEGYEFKNLIVTGADQIDNTNQYTVTGNLTINYSEQIKTFEITIAVNNSEYGKLNIYSVTVPYGTTYTTSGNILTFSNDTEIIATASNNTAQYTYTFANWSSDSGTVTAEATIIANFNRVTNSYTVTFYDENKITVLDTLTDEYGTSIVYSGEEPTKSVDNTYTYTFECWETVDGEEYDLSGKTITSDLVLYARYRATYIEYDIAEIPTQVVIKKGEKVLTSSDTIHYGDRIEITYTVTTGYNMTEFSVTGATRDGETNFYTVTGDLTVIYSEEIQTFAVTIEVNNAEYGSLNIYSVTVPYGTTYVAEGNTLTFSDNTKVIAEKFEDTAQYTYTFTGWSSDSGTITAEEIITANFNRVTNSYTVTFYDENRTTVLDTLTDEYGTSIVYSGANPTKPADNTYAYTFECWGTADGEEYDLSGKTITSDLALYAKYRATYIEYDIAEIPSQVVIKKGEKVLTSSDTIHYGDRIEITYTVTTGYNMTEFSVTGATREGETNIYTVTGDLTVIYSEEIQTFTVQWLNYDGTLLETDTVAYGSIPEYNGEIPVRESTDDEYVYTFTGWDPETNEAKENISYTAQFRQDEILYFTITRGMITGYTGTDTEVIIPNSYSIAPDGRIITGDAYDVTSIGEAAFQNNSNITSITIPANVTSIENRAFSGCTGLTEINYNATNLAYIPDYDNVFSNAGKDGTVVNIGANVTRIPANLFYDSNIATVKFEENSQCTKFGEDAFMFCSNLANVYYEGTIEGWMEISFDNYSANPLNNGANLYVNGDELVTAVNIDSSSTIKAYVFQGCKSITKVTIGSQVNRIRDWAFFGCSNLANVYYEGTIEEWMKISFDGSGSNPLSNGANLYVNGDELVTEVSIDSFSTIKDYVFDGCTSLTKVTIGSQVTSIGEDAFSGCSGLTSITIPANVTSIGSSAFDGCTGLIEINYNATNLEDLSAYNYIFSNAGEDGAGIVVNIGANVRRIPASLFYPNISTSSSPNIVTVNFAENSQCTEIGNNAFMNCGNIANVYYGGTIDEWMKISFDNYSANPLNNGANLYVNGDELVTEVNIDSSSTIKDYIFYGCTSLTKVTIGSQVTSIGDNAFRGCDNLANVYYEGTIEEWMEISFGGYDANPLSNGANLYVNGDELVTEVSIDSFSTIKDYVFDGCTSLTKVTIGSQVTSIGSSAFSGCSGLTSITIPANVTSIGSSAFSGCSGLTSITIPANVTSIGSSAFSGCTGLIEINYNATNLADLSRNNYVFRNAGEDGVGIVVNIGANVTRIPAYLFNPYDSSSSPNIVTVNFAENSQCTEIGEYAFRYCGSLTGITIPASVTSIGERAFSGCTGLTSITIPDSVTSIGSSAFSGCTGLTSITIPGSVTSIGSRAFFGCNLTSVTIESNYAYKNAGTTSSQCGYLLQDATVVRVLTSCIGEDTNSYLENTSNFTKTIDGEYTVYTKV